MRPSIETIEATFDYRDGGLYRKTNGRRGYLRPDGYVYVRLGGRSFGEHRLVHMMFSGDWPDQVDHVNGNRSDNRPENLRSATHAQNCMNRKPMSKAKGCYWMASRGKWMVQIGVGGSRRTIGYFDSIESARAAYRNAAEEILLGATKPNISAGHTSRYAWRNGRRKVTGPKVAGSNPAAYQPN